MLSANDPARINALSMLRTSLPHRCLEWKSPRRFWNKPPKSDHTAVRITGGIGDLVVSLPAAQALNNIVGDVVVYSKWPDVSKCFAPDLPAKAEKSLEDKGLDWIINPCGPVTFQFANNFNGFKNSRMNDLFIENKRFMSKNEFSHIVECHPFLDCIMATKGLKMGLDRRSISFAFLGLPFNWPEPIDWPVTLDQIPQYITVHDGFDNLIETDGARATKTWDLEQWRYFVREFKINTSGRITVVQLGGKNSRHIEGVDVDLCGQLTFEKSVSILNVSLCHVDGDSGLVHAANRIGTKSVVMFGPTDIDFFGYHDNVNLRSSYCSNCWWTKQDWMSKCALGYETPRCMDKLRWETVLAEVIKVVDAQVDISDGGNA